MTARAHGLAGKTLLEEVRHGVSGTMPAWEIADVHVAPLLDMESGYGMPLMKKVLKMRGVIGSAAVRQPGLRVLDDHAREEMAQITDTFADLMLPAYSHRH